MVSLYKFKPYLETVSYGIQPRYILVSMKYDSLQAFITSNGSIRLEWADSGDNPGKKVRLLQKEIYKRFTSEKDLWLLFLGFCDPKITLSPSLTYIKTIAGSFARKIRLTPELDRLADDIDIPISKQELAEFLDLVPGMAGAEYVDRQWLQSLWVKLNDSFSIGISSFKGSIEDFIEDLSPDVHLVGRVFFHLVENKNGDEPFAFLATYSTGLNEDGQSRHLPLQYALREYSDDQEKLLELLSTVNIAARNSEFIARQVESGEIFHPLSWSAGEAFTFLKEIPLYEDSGVLCRIPNWWKGNSSGVQLGISLGENKPSMIGMDALLSFDARLMIQGMEITESEAEKLIESSEGLAFIKNKWVPVDPDKLKQTLDAYEKARELMGAEDGFTMRDALRMQLTPEKLLGLTSEDNPVTVSNGRWLKTVMEKLRHPESVPKVNVTRKFKASLRGYQHKGLNWLCMLDTLGFGACLADDMGLGKTVQLLAFLNATNEKTKGNASLLIIPASLIANWVSEIERFFPSLNYFVAHPSSQSFKKAAPLDKKEVDGLDLIITTYALSYKYKWIQNHTWNYIVLDEAQAIKNPNTKQTRSIKKLKSKNRIIMTGTPIENRLSDLWSLFDFLNPGLLGSIKEFAAFLKKLKDDTNGYGRLKKIISPYILRRLKTDKSIISDLPEKVEMKTYSTLTKTQIVLYQKLVDEIAQVILESDGMQRRGLILASLMKFKQLCNHPDQYLGGGDFKEKNSGKFGRLREICDTIYEKREKVLVFTQFKEMTEPLAKFLSTIFSRDGLILHGSIPVSKRKQIIQRFQSEEYVPFMVLSLKAGGVGLNLTQANHVIHFDRWWNPAVENQATDRAFRIGQKKNVIVHKFVTKGTVEEKIDQMLLEKEKLSREVIEKGGETWITEMSNDEILDLFKLTL